MVFIGGWRSRRRRRYDPYYDPYGYPPGYARRRGPGGGSCLRDLFFVETGCCLADALGCGPQLLLVGPPALRQVLHARPSADGGAGHLSRPSRAALAAIETYQHRISPHRAPCCRYTPTCSHYAADAIRAHGARRGSLLTARRLVRCRPGAVGGPDPVP